MARSKKTKAAGKAGTATAEKDREGPPPADVDGLGAAMLGEDTEEETGEATSEQTKQDQKPPPKTTLASNRGGRPRRDGTPAQPRKKKPAISPNHTDGLSHVPRKEKGENIFEWLERDEVRQAVQKVVLIQVHYDQETGRRIGLGNSRSIGRPRDRWDIIAVADEAGVFEVQPYAYDSKLERIRIVSRDQVVISEPDFRRAKNQQAANAAARLQEQQQPQPAANVSPATAPAAINAIIDSQRRQGVHLQKLTEAVASLIERSNNPPAPPAADDTPAEPFGQFLAMLKVLKEVNGNGNQAPPPRDYDPADVETIRAKYNQGFEDGKRVGRAEGVAEIKSKIKIGGNGDATRRLDEIESYLREQHAKPNPARDIAFQPGGNDIPLLRNMQAAARPQPQQHRQRPQQQPTRRPQPETQFEDLFPGLAGHDTAPQASLFDTTKTTTAITTKTTTAITKTIRITLTI